MGPKKSTSTPISKGAALSLSAALLLGGCEGFDLGALSGQLATQEIRLEGGLRIRAPFGKCIDTSRTLQADGVATVVMANCSNLGGRADVGARDAALLFVTVTPRTHGDLARLSETLQASPELLARSGSADQIALLSVQRSELALYANVIDESAGGPEGVSSQHWKGALDVAERGVVISVFGKVGGPIEGRAGVRLARDTAQTLIDANQDTPPPSATAAEAAPLAEPAPEAETQVAELPAVESQPESTDASDNLMGRFLGRVGSAFSE